MRLSPLILSLLALAGIVAAGLVGWQIGRTGTPATAPLDALTTDTLGERLMARVGKRFVADNRHGRPVAGGDVVFYDAPLPYGESLCWTTSYTVPAAVVDDRAPAQGEPLGGNVAVEEIYGIWKPPTSPAQPDQVGRRACAAYRDFDHIFRVSDGKGSAGERAAYLLDTLLGRAKTGRLDVHARCFEVPPGGRNGSCDVIALLKRLTLQQLSNVETKAEKRSAHMSIYTDELTLWTGRDRGRETVMLTVVSEQPDPISSSSDDPVKILNTPIVLPAPHIVSLDAVVTSLD